MKYIMVCIVGLILLTSCASSVMNWDIRLEQPVARETLDYTDEDMAIRFSVDDRSISFELTNKTKSGLKINYDELSYISPGGGSLRIVTSNIRFADRFAPQAPVVVPPGLNISETLIPAQNIFFRANDYVYGWDVVPLFSANPQAYVGKEFGLYFPMEINGKKVEHIFKFKIHSIKSK